ncbi:MAG: dCTP deaminase [Thermoplasmataceae archaeon]
MTVYSDQKILELAKGGNLIGENFDVLCVTPNGYDLRIDQVWISGSLIAGEAVIPGGSHFLVSTMEYIRMPEDAMGQIWIRSSYARKGIFGSFGAVDGGFHGNLTLSFLNASGSSVTVSKGDRIAQLVVHDLSSRPDQAYGERSGNFQGSRGVTVKGRNIL